MNFLGESPLWHLKNNKWMWTDIIDKTIYNMPVTGSLTLGQNFQISAPQMISNLILLNDYSLLISAESCLFKMHSETGEIETLINLPHSDLFRCNDGSIGPDGKYWFGTMEKTPTGLNGNIYSLDNQNKIFSQCAPIGIPNSFIWLDEVSILISDSLLQKTFKVYLKKDGQLDWGNRSVWLDFSDTNTTPDGGAMDEDGNIWLAIWGGAAIHKYSPNGELLEKILLRALQPTSCAFGGPNMDTLLITSATEGMTSLQLAEYPDSGKVLQYQLSVKGKVLPMFELDIC